MTSSTTDLTKEQRKLFSMVRMRATSAEFGQPYIADMLFAMKPVHSPGVGKPRIDARNHVYIDFDGLTRDDVPALTSELLHLAWHPLLDHADRGSSIKQHNHDRWTIATDGEVQRKLDTKKGQRPEGYIVPKDHGVEGDLLAEAAFALMAEKEQERLDQERQQQEQSGGSGEGDGGEAQDAEGDGQGDGASDGDASEGQGGDGSQGQGQGTSDGDGSGEGSGQGDGSEGDAGQGSGTGSGASGSGSQGSPGQPGTGAGGQSIDPSGVLERERAFSGAVSCGSGAGGQPDDYEVPSTVSPGKSQSDMDVVRKRVANAVLQNAGRPGNAPGRELIEWARKVRIKRPVPWDKVVEGKFRRGVNHRLGEETVTWTRRSILAPSLGKVLLPGDVSPTVRAMVAADTSGSNQGNLLHSVLRIEEMAHKLDIKGKDLRFFSVDTEASEAKMVHSARDIDLQGGGGTDMRVAFDVMSTQPRSLRPDIGILFTDGETPWPTVNPDRRIKWIVCITPNSYRRGRTPRETLADLNVPEWCEGVVIDTLD